MKNFLKALVKKGKPILKGNRLKLKRILDRYWATDDYPQYKKVFCLRFEAWEDYTKYVIYLYVRPEGDKVLVLSPFIYIKEIDGRCLTKNQDYVIKKYGLLWGGKNPDSFDLKKSTSAPKLRNVLYYTKLIDYEEINFDKMQSFAFEFDWLCDSI